jgi:hypothetical protein
LVSDSFCVHMEFGEEYFPGQICVAGRERIVLT